MLLARQKALAIDRNRPVDGEDIVVVEDGLAYGVRRFAVYASEARPGWLFVVGRCSAAPNSEILITPPDTPAGAETVNAVAQAALRAIDLTHIELEASIRGFPAG